MNNSFQILLDGLLLNLKNQKHLQSFMVCKPAKIDI